MSSIIRYYLFFIALLDRCRPAILLVIRLWIAHVFWASGILKISDWDNTVMLFTDEHPVSGLPPQMAALFGTTFELACPVLLTLGLAARIATLPLLVMTAVINFTYLNTAEHYYWAMLLGTILFFGAGAVSADHVIARRYRARQGAGRSA